MNNVTLIGNLTKDPEVNYSNDNAICKFTIAVNKPNKGEEKQADFIRIVTFGRLAERCGQFLAKGRQVGITGHINTGSYKGKDGQTVYTTDVVGDRVDFLGKPETRDNKSYHNYGGYSETPAQRESTMFDNFSATDDYVPF